MYKIITSNGLQGDYAREQIVAAVKQGKLSGKSVILDLETGQYMEAINLFRNVTPAAQRPAATPMAPPSPTNVATSASPTHPATQQRAQPTSPWLVGIVVAALLLLGVSAITTRWFDGGEQPTVTSSSNSPSVRLDPVSKPNEPAHSAAPVESKAKLEVDNSDEKEKWREEREGTQRKTHIAPCVSGRHPLI